MCLVKEYFRAFHITCLISMWERKTCFISNLRTTIYNTSYELLNITISSNSISGPVLIKTTRKIHVQLLFDEMTCLMTSLRPGHSPPHVTIAAFTSSGLKYIFSRGPARWTLEIFNTIFIRNRSPPNEKPVLQKELIQYVVRRDP